MRAADSRAIARGRGMLAGEAKSAFAPWADPGARPLVRVEAVTRRFGGLAAVDRLSLEIYQGEFFALLGPSGCGKTTLLRMIAGFERPNDGRILLDGVDITRVPPYRRPINMMFQSYALFPHLTVEGNIAFGLKQDGLRKEEIAGRVADMLALVKLEGLGRRKPQQLSGGQRQRVALARSLVKRPRVLLLDEPMAALDKKLRAETQFELMELQRKLGLTFVIVTHDQSEAMTVADRIAVMDRGQLMQVATPANIYEQPNSRWVADFIGDVNVFEGRLGDDKTSIEGAPAGRLRVATPIDADSGATVWVAVRPEKMRLTSDKPEQTENCVVGEVADVGYLGDLTTYKVRIADGSIVKSAVANVSRQVEHAVAIGDWMWLSFAPEAAVVLTR
jgi:putrescine transport system ATP-binding protein